MATSTDQTIRNKHIIERFIASQNIREIDHITTWSIQEYLLSLRLAGRSAKTIRNHHAAMSCFCGYLTDCDLLAANPCRGTKLPPVEKHLVQPLTDDECRLALSIAREHDIYCEVCLALNTGLRLSELRRLRWIHVNLTGRYLEVHKSKARRPRRVWLNSRAADALRRQFARFAALEYVFPGGRPTGGRRVEWDTPRMRGLDWWSRFALKPLIEAIAKFRQLPKGSTGRGWHLLRHTFASRAAQNGVPIVKLSKWLGHSRIETTMIYAHLSNEFDPDIEKV